MHFDYFYSKGGAGWTVQAINSYVRVRVILTGTTDTTYFRLQTALCPMVEALPRCLSHSGRLKTENQIEDPSVDRYVNITTSNELRIAEATRLVGTSFDGYNKDPSFWAETVTGSGTITQKGNISLQTGSTADSTTMYRSVRRARKLAGISMQFKAEARFATAGTTDNIRRIGAYDDDDGFFFKLNGTTFSVVARINGLDTNKIS